ncbi:DUF2200 domain-containing protein [Leptospira ellisii]|uniref:DUF2200 domain-containing protein n=1 Tax=Leptospira ellisii TaxID=2023197 RepID=A0A2N0BAL3_9LEPT|nr:DUF2200 domain-containing protein [Leptospira ellisii]MDV6234742.1 DUF2200 domain-containing protein [Leptospira ellisii]PJZ93575.1 hypothetical protein CH379_07135 [Leptospira ellisii]PKA04563.1 hypothetical protein CH375_10220 [Leptospira ellisii]
MKKEKTDSKTTEKKPRIFSASFSSVYPLYIQKVEKKGRTKAEVDTIVRWLTGYDQKSLLKQIKNEVSFEDFFDQAPQINENVSLIKGMICGYRVEEIEDELMRNIRYLDKLIDELAKGKSMEKILRGSDL